MAELSERDLREQAYLHRGEVVPGSGTPVEGRRLDQMVSVRLEPETIIALREIAERRSQSVSELLREGASRVIAAEQHQGPRVELSSITVTLNTTPPYDSQAFQTSAWSGVVEGSDLQASTRTTTV